MTALPSNSENRTAGKQPSQNPVAQTGRIASTKEMLRKVSQAQLHRALKAIRFNVGVELLEVRVSLLDLTLTGAEIFL